MESTGIMQEIERLLAQGNSSRQIINMGYAPGTVYKVQRRFRCKAGMAQTDANESPRWLPTPAGAPTPAATIVTLIDRLQQYQKERDSLRSEVQRLSSVAEEANGIRSQLSSLRIELDSVNRERCRLDSEVTRLTEDSRRLTGQLQEAHTENINLTGYLASKNCQWDRDFSLYLRQREQRRCIRHAHEPQSSAGCSSVTCLPLRRVCQHRGFRS